MYAVIVKFSGEWAIITKYKPKTAAKEGLAYWQKRISWPLKIHRL